MSVITEEEFQEVVETVWMTVLELPVSPGESMPVDDQNSCIATISISGAWQGAVMVNGSHDFLRMAASVMFGKTEDAVNSQDCMDTLTELTNMLGGTFKCLLPETCDLSLPEIITAASIAAGSHEWMYFDCNGYPLSVTLTEHTADQSNAA